MGITLCHTYDLRLTNLKSSNFCWNRFWPWLASQFGLTASPPPADDDGKYTTIEMQQESEVGYPYRANIKYQFLLSREFWHPILPPKLKYAIGDWCQDKQNRADWQRMGEEFGLDLTLMNQAYM